METNSDRLYEEDGYDEEAETETNVKLRHMVDEIVALVRKQHHFDDMLTLFG